MNSIHFGAIIKDQNSQQINLLCFSKQAGANEQPYRILLTPAAEQLPLEQLQHGQFGKIYGDWRKTIFGSNFIFSRWQIYPLANWHPQLQSIYRLQNKHRINAWEKIIKYGKKYFQPLVINGVQLSPKESYEKAKIVLATLKDVDNHPPYQVYLYFNSISLDANGLYQSSLNQALIKSIDDRFSWNEISNQLAIIKTANEAIYNEVFCQLNDLMI